jgi:hypothetical protein
MSKMLSVGRATAYLSAEGPFFRRSAENGGVDVKRLREAVST